MDAYSARTFALMALAAGLMTGMVGLGAAPAAQTQQQSITIGTGSVLGTYFPTGVAVCGAVRAGINQHHVDCSAVSGGSVLNLNAIRAGDLDMGIVQSDWLYQAYSGTGRFAERGADKNLRTVLSLYTLSMSLVARADGGIRRLADLSGKRADIGIPGSPTRSAMNALMNAADLSIADFAASTELRTSSEKIRALCNGQIDAALFITSHPSDVIKDATTTCDAIIVDVSGPAIDKLIAGNTYYRHAVVPGGLYRGTKNNIPTVGLSTTLVSSTAVPAQVVYEVVKAVFENLDWFRSKGEWLADLTKAEMATANVSAPLHDGAARYFRQVGMIE